MKEMTSGRTIKKEDFISGGNSKPIDPTEMSTTTKSCSVSVLALTFSREMFQNQMILDGSFPLGLRSLVSRLAANQLQF